MLVKEGPQHMKFQLLCIASIRDAPKSGIFQMFEIFGLGFLVFSIEAAIYEIALWLVFYKNSPNLKCLISDFFEKRKLRGSR